MVHKWVRSIKNDVKAGGDATMTVGSFIEATISWDMRPLDGVTFYLHQCHVETGAANVEIIKDGCYSNALSVSPGISSPNTIPFSYIAFTARVVKIAYHGYTK